MCTYCRISRFAALTALALLLGCNNSTFTSGTQSFSWVHAADGVTPGIDRATVDIVTVEVDREPVRFALWYAGVNTMQSGTSSGRYHANAELSNGATLAVVFDAMDASSGTMTIGDEQFKVADGPLFLIAESANRVRVEQIAYDIETLPRTVDAMSKLGQQETRIASFFKNEAAKVSGDSE